MRPSRQRYLPKQVSHLLRRIGLVVFEPPKNQREQRTRIKVAYGRGRDVGAAFAKGVNCPEIRGKTILIGGGPRCQFHYRELVTRILEATEVGMLPAEAFSQTPFSTDWLDTSESQRLLNYQNRTLDNYLKDLRALLGGACPSSAPSAPSCAAGC